MLNSASIRTINNARFSQRFVKPCYDSYCFANLPASIEYLLTGKGQHVLPPAAFGYPSGSYDNVVFFFIDAFGWKFFERFANRSAFLKAVMNEGVVSKLTSQFPSTTAAHVTCIHTGLEVGQSGVYEWQYYEPLVDDIISPLLFSLARDKLTPDTLKRSGIPAELFFPRCTLFHKLQGQGVTSHVFQYRAYASSTYSSIVFRGANIHPYGTLQEALTQLAHALQVERQVPSYYFLYFDRIDAICHQYGPHSKQCEAVISDFLTMLDEIFYKSLRGKISNTLFMMTADHGQVEVDPRTTFYLNKELPGIERWFKINTRGQPIVPAGSPRDMFLHIKEEYIDDAMTLLQQRLAGKAEVYRTQELLAQHFFGLKEPTAVFLARVGNIVILPYALETVWWYEEGKFAMHFRGHHGGLLPEEMEIPLLFLPL